jgi:GrpB-like predicted nucleotidyltransferase (UPF0157 family)
VREVTATYVRFNKKSQEKQMSKNLDEMTDEERAQLFPIVLSEHKSYWQENYRKEKTALEQAVGVKNIVRINHIGSTAIPNLIAKPTIDILIEIVNDIDVEKLIANMQSAGYRHIKQPTTPIPHWFFIKGYTPQGFEGQVFHVHVNYSGDWDELLFRDYLLRHPETAVEYGKLKLELQKKFEHNRDGYTDAKTDFIKRIVQLARAENSKAPANK